MRFDVVRFVQQTAIQKNTNSGKHAIYFWALVSFYFSWGWKSDQSGPSLFNVAFYWLPPTEGWQYTWKILRKAATDQSELSNPTGSCVLASLFSLVLVFCLKPKKKNIYLTHIIYSLQRFVFIPAKWNTTPTFPHFSPSFGPSSKTRIQMNLFAGAR